MRARNFLRDVPMLLGLHLIVAAIWVAVVVSVSSRFRGHMLQLYLGYMIGATVFGLIKYTWLRLSE